MFLYPTIRVVSLCVFAACCAYAALPALIAAGACVALIYYRTASDWRRALGMVLRLRWLFLIILVVYVWMTPLPEPGALWWQPSSTGFAEGALRVIALVLVVMAVNLLIQTTSRAQLIDAIYQIVTPLSIFGVERDRVAVRVALTLKYVTHMQELVTRCCQDVKWKKPNVKQFGEIAAQIYRSVLFEAEQIETETVRVECFGRPPLVQWVLPLAIFIGFSLIAMYYGKTV